MKLVVCHLLTNHRRLLHYRHHIQPERRLLRDPHVSVMMLANDDDIQLCRRRPQQLVL
jgi:hypothetical protein